MCNRSTVGPAGIAPTTEPDNWPQWRGPGGLAVGNGVGYPDTWSATDRIVWKTAIPGRGHSSPVVWGDRIFLTTSIEGAPVPGTKPLIHLGWDMKPGYVHPDSVGSDHAYALKVQAVDGKSGKILWDHTIYDGPMYDDRHRKNTYASPRHARPSNPQLGVRPRIAVRVCRQRRELEDCARDPSGT